MIGGASEEDEEIYEPNSPDVDEALKHAKKRVKEMKKLLKSDATEEYIKEMKKLVDWKID